MDFSDSEIGTREWYMRKNEEKAKRISELEDELSDLQDHQEYIENRQEGLVDELKECYKRISELEAILNPICGVLGVE